MCLSTIIKRVDGKDAGELCSNVSEVDISGTRITFTDIIGATHEVEGKISSVDLIKNKIFVDVAEQIFRNKLCITRLLEKFLINAAVIK